MVWSRCPSCWWELTYFPCPGEHPLNLADGFFFWQFPPIRNIPSPLSVSRNRFLNSQSSSHPRFFFNVSATPSLSGRLFCPLAGPFSGYRGQNVPLISPFPTGRPPLDPASRVGTGSLFLFSSRHPGASSFLELPFFPRFFDT